ncbi:MAG: methyltransferase domain-containing protein [Mesotoga sp.]|nr:methyltransferase domain-containing protein [Mesotoga sp.]
MTRFLKFCIVGGTGAIITWGLTWLFTERLGLWYMVSVIIATGFAMINNFAWNSTWTFKTNVDPENPAYEWDAFYHGNPMQRWWKHRIADYVWGFIPNQGKLLNVGCGSSPIAMHYPHSYNIDLDTAKLEFMHLRMPYAHFKQGNACSLEFLDASFDSVICIEVIEHTPYPEKVVSEIARVLRVGGTAVIATPDYAKMRWHVAEMFTPYKEWHGAKLTRTAVESLARANGLVPKECKYVAGCDLVEYFVKE